MSVRSPAPSSPFSEELRAHHQAVEGFFARHGSDVETLAERLAATFRAGSTLLLCGNGGSACDAMHVAGEFTGRFNRTRRGLPALALSADSGALTAIGNDFGFEQIFARQVEALGKSGDLLIALSTSGNSANVLAALREARARKIYTVLLTGEKGAGRASECDMLLVVPSANTARIQEAHHLALHLLTDRVDALLEPGPESK